MSNMSRFSFVAQSLDNQTPDVLVDKGQLLDDRDSRSTARTSLVDNATYVSSRGKRYQSSDHTVTAYLYGMEIVVQVDGSKLDASGRTAPILCYGDVRGLDPELAPEILADELEDFAQRIGRELSPRQLSNVNDLVGRVIGAEGSTAQPGSSRLSGVKFSVPHFKRRSGHEDLPAAALPSLPSGALPVRSQDRRVIAVVDNALERRLKTKAGQSMRKVLTLPGVFKFHIDDTQGDPLATELDRVGLLRPGAILVQNPYDPDEYFEMQGAEESIAKSAAHTWVEICEKLGATRVQVRIIAATSERTATLGEVAASATLVGQSGNLESSSQEDGFETASTDMEYVRVYVHHAPDYQDARRLIMERGLSWDSDLRGLVEQFATAGKAPTSHHDRHSTRSAFERIGVSVQRLRADASAIWLQDGELVERQAQQSGGERAYSFDLEVTFGQSVEAEDGNGGVADR